MTDRPLESARPDASPLAYARIGGFLYLFIIVAGLFGEMFVRGELIVRGDAATTATNILGSETLFRVGLAGELLTCVCDVALALILYVLLKPVNRNLALLAAFFRVTFVGVYAFSKMFLVAALVLMKGADYLQAFEAQQLQSLAYFTIRLHGLGYGLSLIFFGFSIGLLGYLIWKSGYLPKVIGLLLVIGGLCYVTFNLVQTLAPDTAAKLFPWLLLPAFPAELGLCLWLIVKGVDVPGWQARARRTG